MSLLYDVDATTLIYKTADELKKIQSIKPPVWATFCKTGMSKERPPTQTDWWYLRAASILRTAAMHGPIGVSKLRTRYGGRKNRGHKPDRFYRGAGNLIRKIFQQLEKADLLKQTPKDAEHKGRIVSPKGHSLLDKVALTLIKASPRLKPRPAPAAPTESGVDAKPGEKTEKMEKEKSEKPAEEKKKKISIQA